MCESAAATASKDGTPTRVLGKPLAAGASAPMTGFYRAGYCRTGPRDGGVHVVRAKVDRASLDNTRAQDNDLETPVLAFSFPDLSVGDRRCLCAAR